MNCKPGDLAFVVGGGEYDPAQLGKVIRVLALDSYEPNAWLYEGALLTHGGQRYECVYDG
jgi:hypothetical protein